MTRAGATSEVSPPAAFRRHLLHFQAAVASTRHVVPHCHLFTSTFHSDPERYVFFTYPVWRTKVRIWFSVYSVNALLVLMFCPVLYNEVAGEFIWYCAVYEIYVNLRTKRFCLGWEHTIHIVSEKLTDSALDMDTWEPSVYCPIRMNLIMTIQLPRCYSYYVIDTHVYHIIQGKCENSHSYWIRESICGREMRYITVVLSVMYS